jgi:DNA-binding NarL/FixJ family response regulator
MSTVQPPGGAQRRATGDPVRVVIADDHEVVRRGVRWLLTNAPTPGYKVVAEVADARAALNAVRRLEPDLLILDVSMPPSSGLDILDLCVRARPQLAAVVFTMHTELAFVRQALTAGARAYVLKDARAREVLSAFALAVMGSTYLPPGVANALAEPAAPAPMLEVRERTVLRLIALGYKNALIAGEVGVSERTVKNIRSNIVAKLGICERHELTQWALANGIVDRNEVVAIDATSQDPTPRTGSRVRLAKAG